MKKLLTLLLSLLTLSTVFAADFKEVTFASRVTGITFTMPDNAAILNDDIEALILQTPDKMFTLTAEAFNVTEATQDEISEHLVEMANSARMDLQSADKIDNTTENVTLIGLSNDYENGAATIVAVAVVNDTDLGFYITIVVGPDYVDTAVNTIVSIDFNPDVVEE